MTMIIIRSAVLLYTFISIHVFGVLDAEGRAGIDRSDTNVRGSSSHLHRHRHYIRPHEWSPWGQWSVCSAICGTGVSGRSRNCLRDSIPVPPPHPCSGSSRQFMICNVEACRKGQSTLREKECTLFNDQRFSGRNYRWLPFVNPLLPCEVTCRAEGHTFYARLGGDLPDGASCGKTTKGVCIGGACRTVGCDGIVDSDAQLDQCGVCKGNNSTCRVINGIYTHTNLPHGYSLIARIPAGARNINISEIRHSRNYLALESKVGSFNFNVNWEISPSGEYEGVGTTFQYELQTESCAGECIYAPGPTTHEVDLMILYYEENRGITYTYSMPLTGQPRLSLSSTSADSPEMMDTYNNADQEINHRKDDWNRQKIGCDGVHNSFARFDECGVCKGDNSTCRIIHETYFEERLPYGYNTIAAIPAGAARLTITAVKESINYISLKSANEGFLLNADWQIMTSGDYIGVGTTFTYQRGQSSDCASECIFALGPTNQTLILMLLFYEKNTGVAYKYTLPTVDAAEESMLSHSGHVNDMTSASRYSELKTQSEIRVIEEGDRVSETAKTADGPIRDLKEYEMLTKAGREDFQSVNVTRNATESDTSDGKVARGGRVNLSEGGGNVDLSLSHSSATDEKLHSSVAVENIDVNFDRNSYLRDSTIDIDSNSDTSRPSDGNSQSESINKTRATKNTENYYFLKHNTTADSDNTAPENFTFLDRFDSSDSSMEMQSDEQTSESPEIRETTVAPGMKSRKDRKRLKTKTNEGKRRPRKWPIYTQSFTFRKRKRKQKKSNKSGAGRRNMEKEITTTKPEKESRRLDTTSSSVVSGADSYSQIRSSESSASYALIPSHQQGNRHPNNANNRSHAASTGSRPAEASSRTGPVNSHTRTGGRDGYHGNVHRRPDVLPANQDLSGRLPHLPMSKHLTVRTRQNHYRLPSNRQVPSNGYMALKSSRRNGRPDTISRTRDRSSFPQFRRVDSPTRREPHHIPVVSNRQSLTSGRVFYRNTLTQSSETQDRYNVRQGQELLTNAIVDTDSIYSWRISGFTDCTESCGGGTQETVVVCVKGNSQVIVTNDNCNKVLRPDIQVVVCNSHPCPAKWYVSDWGQCSVTCGEGVQSREVACRQRLSVAMNISRPHETCLSTSEQPPSARPCEKDPCFKWKTGNWTKCSAACGKGMRQRDVSCIDSTGSRTDDDYCSNSRPAVEGICDMGSCGKGWYFTQWSKQCSASCGTGAQHRSLHCAGDDGITLNENKCALFERPRTNRECVAEQPCGGFWFTAPWSKCNVSCGTGFKTRDVICVKRLNGGLFTLTPENNCAQNDKPETNMTCDLDPCIPQWYIARWTECSTSCGTGYRTRELKCLDSYQQPSLLCNFDSRPSVRESCNVRPCDSTTHVPDSDCQDSYSRCMLVVKSRMCRYQYYAKMCCASCSQADFT